MAGYFLAELQDTYTTPGDYGLGIAVDTDNYDVVHITAQTATITSIATTGTPVDGDTLRISITGTAAVPFTLAATNFEPSTVALSTTTTGTARLDMGFFWSPETGKWRQVAVA